MSSVFHFLLQSLLDRPAQLPAKRLVEGISDEVDELDVVSSTVQLNGFVLLEPLADLSVNADDHAHAAAGAVGQEKSSSGGEKSCP